MSNLFQKLELEAFRAGITPRTEESRKWFRKRMSEMRGSRINRTALAREDVLSRESKADDIGPGSMVMFSYDPKTKDKLPYYDTFPLIIMMEEAPGGFYGLNVHYLPPVLRAKFLDALMDVTNNKKFDKSTVFKVSYGMLKRASRMKYFKPCFKHYLTNHVRSKFSVVHAPEWEIAIFLPTAQFKKESAASVYKDSRRIING